MGLEYELVDAKDLHKSIDALLRDPDVDDDDVPVARDVQRLNTQHVAVDRLQAPSGSREQFRVFLKNRARCTSS